MTFEGEQFDVCIAASERSGLMRLTNSDLLEEAAHRLP
jgi:hypothetical protein